MEKMRSKRLVSAAWVLSKSNRLLFEFLLNIKTLNVAHVISGTICIDSDLHF